MPARPGNRKHKTIAGAAEAAPAGQRLPVDLAAHHGLHAPAGPHLAGIVDEQFNDRVVADLAALADAVMAVRARQRVLRSQPRGQRGIRRARGGVLEPRRRADEGAYREVVRSEEHTSELQSLMRISYAVFCLKKKKKKNTEIIGKR